MPTPIDTYLAKIEADYRKGLATEHTYRSALISSAVTGKINVSQANLEAA